MPSFTKTKRRETSKQAASVKQGLGFGSGDRKKYLRICHLIRTIEYILGMNSMHL